MSRSGISLSIAFHALLMIAAIIGVPRLWSTPTSDQGTIDVELVTLSNKVSAPAPVPQSKPQDKPKQQQQPAQATQAKPKQQTQTAEAQVKLDMPAPLPLPDVQPVPQPQAAAEPVVLPKPQPLAKPTPAPKPEVAQPQPQPAPATQVAAPVPVQKPKAPEKPTKQPSFNQVAKSLLVNKAPTSSTSDSKSKQKADKTTSFAQVASSLDAASTSNVSDKATTNIDGLIRRQITDHWNIPAGAKGIEGMRVYISVALAPDGHVLSASVDRVEGGSDEAVRQALAETALRAVNYFRDHPILGLPLDQYDQWRNKKLMFDPSKMVRS